MPDFKYTTVVGKLTDFFEKIRDTGIPSKANRQWLESLGYKSKNDRTMRPILKALSFVDDSYVPQDRWKQYRGNKHKSIMAQAIKEGYAELFQMYPDACGRSDTELEHFFSTRTTGGKQVITKMVGTFKALCSLADFDGASLNAEKPAKVKSKVSKPSKSQDQKQDHSHSNPSLVPSIHIDVQVHISPESSATQIDQIFASMAKHLYKSSD